MRNRNGFRLREVLIVACMIFAGIAAFLPDSVNSIALYGAIPFAFVLSLFDKSRYKNESFKLFVVLSVWLLCTVLWAMDTDAAFRQMRQVLGCLLVSYVVGKNAYKDNMLPWLYVVWLALYVSAIYYANTHIVQDIEFGEERLNDEKLNANMLAYHTFYSTVVIYVLGEILQSSFWRKFFRVLLVGMVYISFFVAIATASRQVLIVQIPLFAFILYIRYMLHVSVIPRIVFVLLISVIGIVGFEYFSELYDNSLLKQRGEMDIEDDSRIILIGDAFKVGMDNFFHGVGAGNYQIVSYGHKFSHNTFLELFANTGIVGVLIYVGMLILYLKKQIGYYRVTGDKLFLLFFVFGVIYCVDNVFYVFYNSQWLVAFFILVSSHSDAYFGKRYRIG